MCKYLKISTSVFYYKAKKKPDEIELENAIIKAFKESRKNYGTRKLKAVLSKEKNKVIVSRRKIGRVMKKYGLVSNYTIKQFKKHSKSCNEDKVRNVVNRKFNDRKRLEVIVSDLTYVKVNGKWNYICSILDLYNREIIGFAAGKNKSANLVEKAFSSIKANLGDISIFHTDRGSEFRNETIDRKLITFKIKRSLSRKGCPYDNAVAEATFKIMKTEFAFDKNFKNFEELEYLLFDYINWYNTKRIHGTLGYMTPVEYKKSLSDKKVS